MGWCEQALPWGPAEVLGPGGSVAGAVQTLSAATSRYWKLPSL